MSKKDEKILEFQYTIEALEDELQDHEKEIEDTKAKLWDVIQENDRLTLTYEPYRPPGDEHEGLDFYELIEENDNLTQNILNKIAVIKELEERIYILERTVQVNKAPRIPASDPKKPRIKNERWWNFSVELWPGAWGLNYYRFNWQKHGSVSREGSIQVGPFGFSWNREPKRL